MEGDIAQMGQFIGAGLAAIGSGAAAIGVGHVAGNFLAGALRNPSAAAGQTATLFIGIAFAYYWFHRSSHRINFLWAAHVVHHQSEEYNLAVALRQSSLQPFFSWVFYLPLAILGFPPKMFFTLVAVNVLYQFWIHTRLLGRLGPFEWILNTPSHHRVHHGQNPQYIARNHGGTLIIWDRMFGTFQVEEETPRYGLKRDFDSQNPFVVWISEIPGLYRDIRRAQSWRSALQYLIRPPGWHPPAKGPE